MARKCKIGDKVLLNMNSEWAEDRTGMQGFRNGKRTIGIVVGFQRDSLPVRVQWYSIENSYRYDDLTIISFKHYSKML